MAGGIPGELDSGSYSFGPFELDLETLELCRGAVEVHLPPQPASLLLLLVRNAQRLVTRDDIQRTCWPDTPHGVDPAINAAIRQIRRALDDSAEEPRYIETLPRRGYRFKHEVVHHPEDATSGGLLQSLTRPRWWRALVGFLGIVLVLLISSPSMWSPERASLPEPLRVEYSKAMLLVGSERPADAARSLPFFEQVLEEEPEFAPAWAGLAEARFLTGDREGARVAALTALGQDPHLANAHHVQGLVHLVEDWDFASGVHSLEEATRLAPDSLRYTASLALGLIAQGRTEEAAVLLDEIYSQETLENALRFDAGWMEYLVGRFERSRRLCGAVADMVPRFGWAASCEIASLERLGDLDGAVARAERVLDAFDESTRPWQAESSKREKLAAYRRWRLLQLEVDPEPHSYELAVLHARLGRTDEALHFLDLAAASRSILFVSAEEDPAFEFGPTPRQIRSLRDRHRH